MLGAWQGLRWLAAPRLRGRQLGLDGAPEHITCYQQVEMSKSHLQKYLGRKKQGQLAREQG